MEMSVEFPKAETSDAILLEVAHDQYKIKLKLEGMDENGVWKTLAEGPETSDIPLRMGLRRAAGHEARQRGIDYMVIFDFDYRAEDFKTSSALWGITPVGEQGGAVLYRLD